MAFDNKKHLLCSGCELHRGNNTSLLSAPQQQQQPADSQWHPLLPGLSGQALRAAVLTEAGALMMEMLYPYWKVPPIPAAHIVRIRILFWSWRKGQTMDGFLVQNKLTQKTLRLWAGGFSHGHGHPVHLGFLGVLLFPPFHDNNTDFRLECLSSGAALVQSNI